MYKTVTILIFFFCSTFALSQSVFSNEYIHVIEFEVPLEDYELELRRNYKNSKTRSDYKYVKCNVKIDAEEVRDIGIRYKGASSYKDSLKKKSLKLDFNEFVKGQKFQGLRKLNLHNSIPDPSFLRDAISYELFNQFGVRGPRLSFAKVYINQDYLGLYQVVEQVDKSFTKDKLFKNIAWNSFKYRGTDISNYKYSIDQKGDLDTMSWNALSGLFKVVSNTNDQSFREQISAIFEIDSFLKALIIYVATNNYDSIISSGRNWYLSYDFKEEKFNWIPWDNGYSLGANFNGTLESRQLKPAFCAQRRGDDKVTLIDTTSYSGYAHTSWVLSNGTTSNQKFIEYKYKRNRRFQACLTLSDIKGNQGVLCKDYRPKKISESCSLKRTSYDEYNLPIFGEMSESDLVAKVFADEVLKNRYEELMCDFLGEVMTMQNMTSMIGSLRDLISDEVYKDSNLVFPVEYFRQEVENLESPFHLLNLLESRILYLKSQINCK